MEQLHPATPARHVCLSGARILVVEPDRRIARALSAMLVAASGSTVRACTAEGVLGSQAGSYDAAILDADRLGVDAERVARALLATRRPCVSAMLSRATDPEALQHFRSVGAFAVMTQPLEASAVVEATVRTVAATRSLRRRLGSGEVRRSEPLRLPFPHDPLDREDDPELDAAVDTLSVEAELSPREATVLRFIAVGYRYEAIAAALTIAPRTVKMHAANLRRKVGVRDRLALVRKVFRT